MQASRVRTDSCLFKTILAHWSPFSSVPWVSHLSAWGASYRAPTQAAFPTCLFLPFDDEGFPGTSSIIPMWRGVAARGASWLCTPAFGSQTQLGTGTPGTGLIPRLDDINSNRMKTHKHSILGIRSGLFFFFFKDSSYALKSILSRL